MLLGYLWRFHHVGNDQLLTQSPASLPSSEDREWGCNFRASDYGSVFLVISPYPGTILDPTKCYFIRTKDSPITQEILRDLETLCQEPGSKTDLLEQKILLASLFQGF